MDLKGAYWSEAELIEKDRHGAEWRGADRQERTGLE
jgi:hypothetical protein